MAWADREKRQVSHTALESDRAPWTSPVLHDPDPSRSQPITRAEPNVVRRGKPDFDGPMHGVLLLLQPVPDFDQSLPSLIIRDRPFGRILRELWDRGWSLSVGYRGNPVNPLGITHQAIKRVHLVPVVLCHAPIALEPPDPPSHPLGQPREEPRGKEEELCHVVSLELAPPFRPRVSWDRFL